MEHHWCTIIVRICHLWHKVCHSCTRCATLVLDAPLFCALLCSENVKVLLMNNWSGMRHSRGVCIIHEEGAPSWSMMHHQGSWCAIILMRHSGAKFSRMLKIVQMFLRRMKMLIEDVPHEWCTILMVGAISWCFMVAHDALSWPMMLHHVFLLKLMRMDVLGIFAWHSMTGWILWHPLYRIIMVGPDLTKLGFSMLSYK